VTAQARPRPAQAFTGEHPGFIVTLIVAGANTGCHHGRPRLVQLIGRGRRVNPNQ